MEVTQLSSFSLRSESKLTNLKTRIMKNLILLFSIFFVSSFAMKTSAAVMPADLISESINIGGWEKLGTKKVNYGLDRDEIIVTARDGRFTKLKLKARRGGINMHKMVVHFGDGTHQNVELRNNIPKGGETRVIDLKGGKRVIKKVVFWYDTKNLARKRAKLELWGKH